MATTKNILNHVLVEVAGAKRHCHHNRSHELAKGVKCLVVIEDRGNKRNYCLSCAKPMLAAAGRQIVELEAGLGLGASVRLTPGQD